ncbi:hypothetical protein [Actinotalea sp. C106]|uniref:hypothetical protein n=1 Tax=Actinotalea sp. C106 TaxID=2908644 RepID=UPI0020277C92|nr:hypothetical protein [Actinotalea sp. C106]
MRRVRVVVVGALGVALLVGCSPSGPDQPEVTAPPAAPPTPAASPTPAATPTPTSSPAASGPRDLSDPELGIVFTDFPRDQDEQTAAAIQTYMLFEIEFWKALTTNTVPPGPWAVASDEAIARISAQVDPNAANGWSAAGTLGSAVSEVSVDEATASLEICLDWREATFTNTDGTTVSAAEVDSEPLSKAHVSLVMASTGWQVDTYEPAGPC